MDLWGQLDLLYQWVLWDPVTPLNLSDQLDQETQGLLQVQKVPEILSLQWVQLGQLVLLGLIKMIINLSDPCTVYIILGFCGDLK